jgi:hypothetical protein
VRILLYAVACGASTVIACRDPRPTATLQLPLDFSRVDQVLSIPSVTLLGLADQPPERRPQTLRDSGDDIESTASGAALHVAYGVRADTAPNAQLAPREPHRTSSTGHGHSESDGQRIHYRALGLSSR